MEKHESLSHYPLSQNNARGMNHALWWIDIYIEYNLHMLYVLYHHHIELSIIITQVIGL